ncbi:MAG: amidohydrolase [Candidatus Helarchaeota archaeon]|nr:amidohydrolase [Candidatus Helarchaeota archaeon]
MQDKIVKMFFNCIILTVDANDTVAESMGIFQDKILAVGSKKEVSSEINSFIGNATEKIELEEIDLGGACVVPGFIDAHMHPGFYLYLKTQLNLIHVKSYAELREILQNEDERRKSGDSIVGFLLMEDTFTDPAERRFPNRHDLDTMCSDRPVFVMRHDGHICAVNSAALNQLKITKSNVKELITDSGEIRVDSEGNPTGVFTEEATKIALQVISIPETEQLKKACEETSAELASFGITTCGAIVQAGSKGVEGEAGSLVIPLMESFIREGLIAQDFVFYITTDRPKVLKRLKKSFLKLNMGENRFVVKGIKIYADGSFGARTACLFEPFTDSPEGAKGFMVTKKEDLLKLFKETADLGFDIACHAIGDKANRIVVDAFKEIIDPNVTSPVRCRIEHASLITDDVLADASKLGLILACQPAFINSEYTYLERRLGPERIKHAYPFRSIIDAGIVLAGASDAPIESASVLEGIHACVTRRGFVPEQIITIVEALRVFTYNAAYALGQEDVKGSLETGKLADFVVLEQDVSTVPAEKLADIKILATYHRGKRIYPVK